MPAWVVDYVLVHELAHLLVPGHGADFWELVSAYPRCERARGYLEGVSAASGLGLGNEDEDEDEDDADVAEDAELAGDVDLLDGVDGTSG